MNFRGAELWYQRSEHCGKTYTEGERRDSCEGKGPRKKESPYYSEAEEKTLGKKSP